MAILDRTNQAMNPTHLPDFRPLGTPSTYGMILSLCWLALCSQVCDGQVTDFNVERAYELSTFELPESLKLEVSGMALLPDARLPLPYVKEKSGSLTKHRTLVLPNTDSLLMAFMNHLA